MKKALIWLLPVFSLIGSAAAGLYLAPAPEAAADHAADGEGGGEAKPTGHPDSPAAWFSFPNQFFVPIVRRGEIDNMMVITLTVETSEAALPLIESQEHRLRDALLRSLIIHANTGGFTGNYTAEPKLQRLRDLLLAAAQKVGGADIHAVLIEDLGESKG